MSLVDKTYDVLHKVRVMLYPNSLPGKEGTYFARTANEATLGIEQVCTAKKTRGGFIGNYDDLISNVKKFFDEVEYQLCDGYAVNMGPFTVYPNICGTFTSEKNAYDREKNPIDFRFKAHSRLKKLAKHIDVKITGIYDGNAYIAEFTDTEENSQNNLFVPGNMFCITGNKIKVAGKHPDCGVYFVPVEDPSKAVKVTRILENKPSRISGVCPDTQFKMNRIEIRTQYAVSNTTFLKEPRVITSRFILEAA